MASNGTILDLTSARERPLVKIDHIPYQLRLLDDLGLQQLQTLERLSPRVSALFAQDELSDAENDELCALLERICALALDAPAEILAKLSPVKRAMVAKVFIELLSPSLLAAGVVLEATRPMLLAGMRSSPNSNGSTVAPRKSGSRRPRSG